MIRSGLLKLRGEKGEFGQDGVSGNVDRFEIYLDEITSIW